MPILGQLMTAAGTIFLDRDNKEKSIEALKPAIESLKSGISVIIFPEGTRNPDGEVNPFKPGLFHLAKARPEVAFVPVFIENLNRVLPKGEVLPVPMLCSVTFGESMRLAGG